MSEGPLVERIQGILSAMRGLPEPFTTNDLAISMGEKHLSESDLEALDQVVKSGKLIAHQVNHADGSYHFEYRRPAETG